MPIGRTTKIVSKSDLNQALEMGVAFDYVPSVARVIAQLGRPRTERLLQSIPLEYLESYVDAESCVGKSQVKDLLLEDIPIEHLELTAQIYAKKGREWLENALGRESYQTELPTVPMPLNEKEAKIIRDARSEFPDEVSREDVQDRYPGGIPRILVRLMGGKNKLHRNELSLAERLFKFRESHRIAPFGCRLAFLPGFAYGIKSLLHKDKSHIIGLYPADKELEFITENKGTFPPHNYHPPGALGFLFGLRGHKEIFIPNIKTDVIPGFPPILRNRYRNFDCLLMLGLEAILREAETLQIERIAVAPTFAVMSNWSALNPRVAFHIYSKTPKQLGFTLQMVAPKKKLGNMKLDFAWMKDIAPSSRLGDDSVEKNFSSLINIRRGLFSERCAFLPQGHLGLSDEMIHKYPTYLGSSQQRLDAQAANSLGFDDEGVGAQIGVPAGSKFKPGAGFGVVQAGWRKGPGESEPPWKAKMSQIARRVFERDPHRYFLSFWKIPADGDTSQLFSEPDIAMPQLVLQMSVLSCQSITLIIFDSEDVVDWPQRPHFQISCDFGDREEKIILKVVKSIPQGHILWNALPILRKKITEFAERLGNIQVEDRIQDLGENKDE
ncbi:hypothetical protein ACFL2I_02285 [Candidatus Omnitrophota bacterium]